MQQIVILYLNRLKNYSPDRVKDYDPLQQIFGNVENNRTLIRFEQQQNRFVAATLKTK